MDFSVIDETAEIAAFRKEVREWLAENMKGSEDLRWSASWSTRENEDEYRFRRALGLKMGEKGWLYPMFPKEYGGGGLTVHHQLVLAAEIGRYGMSLDHVFYTLARLVAPCMLHWATKEQKAAFLPPLLKGEIISWQVLTEPQGGSDLATCRTYAVRDGDHYVVNGQKTMVGSTHHPDFLWTIVNTAPDKPRHENLSWIYIPGSLPGITYQPMQLMMGRKNTIFFDNVRVPAFNLVGGENNGWKVANTHLELEHGGDGGLESTNTMERLIDYCKKTGINGSSILEDDKVRETLADIYIELHAAQLFAQRNFFFRYIREPHPYGGVQFRYYNRMVRLRNSARLQQILGFDALIPNHDINEDDDFEYLIRSGPGKLHGGGTLDTDRLIFARRLGLGRPKAERPPVTV